MISYEKMKQAVKENHPYKPNGKPYDCKDVLWRVGPGSHCCLSSQTKSAFDRFGVGIVLYFRFVKRLTLFFFIFALLSIIPLTIYIAAYKTTLDLDSFTFNTFLIASTAGSLGLGKWVRILGNILGTSSVSVTGVQEEGFYSKAYLACYEGTLASVGNIVYGLLYHHRH